MPRKILLLFISEHSGHHCASLAIEKALRAIEPGVRIMNINSFNYTNPILEKVINRAYMSVIKRTPDLWDYLYDNPSVVRRTQSLRDMIHKFNKGKLKTLLDDFAPDVVVCTQAFPCGMVADYKKSFGLSTPLMGVLTDYAPHSYWIYNNVDRYIVPCEETGRSLANNGIDQHKISAFGIPIDPKFASPHRPDREILKGLSLDPEKPCVLIMGGTQGLGPIKEMVALIDNIYQDIQAVIAAGTNKKLYSWLANKKFHKRVVILPFAVNIDELMQVSDVILTKPGGITTAEALAKGLPMLIVNPLPGQEAMNTRYLLSENVAIKADSPQDAVVLLNELLYNSDKLGAMSEKARSIAKPDSAMRIARLIMELAER